MNWQKLIDFITRESCKPHQAAWVGIILAIGITACSTERQQTVVQAVPLVPVHRPLNPEKPQLNPSSLSSQRTSGKSIQDGEKSQQQQAAQVIRQYYNAINQKDYKRAYAYWAANGTASQQSFKQFKQGFADTASVKVDIKEPGRIQGAAGSLYVEIPVTITAKTVKGITQHFTGIYTLRRSNDVPGSTQEQRMWHLYSAKITALN